MALVVQKYGGTSVGDVERIQNVARRVAETVAAGNQVVVCVSAMSGETNKLVALAEEKGLVVAVNHELRLSRLWGGARKLIGDGVIGHPQACLIELSRFPYRGGSEGWRYDIEKVGTGLKGGWVLTYPQGTTTPGAPGRIGCAQIVKECKTLEPVYQLE